MKRLALTLNKNVLIIGISLVHVVLLNGCAVGPDFEPPAVEAPEGWHPPGEENTSTTTPEQPLTAWWTILNDPQLASLVDRAVAANLTVKQTLDRLEQARAARDISFSALLPSVNLSGQGRRFQNNSSRTSVVVGGSGQTGGGTVGVGQGGTGQTAVSGQTNTFYQGGFDASWEIDLFGARRRGLEGAEADVERSLEDLRAARVSLIGEVATRYVNVRGLQGRIAVARRNLELQSRSADIAKRRFDVGFASRLDVANADADRAATAAQIPQLEASLNQEMYMLSTLLAEPPTGLVQELASSAPEPPPIPVVPASLAVGIPSELLRRRPDVKSAEAALHAETARIGVAVADLFPKLTLSGTLLLQGVDFDALGNWGDRIWNLAASASQPLFDGGRRFATVRRQKAVRDEVFHSYHDVVLTALREVETALSNLQKEQARAQVLQEAVAASDRARAAALDLYAAGNTDFLNVATAERALFQSEDQLTSSRQAMAVNLVALYKALGGGWELYDGGSDDVPVKSPDTAERPRLPESE